MSRHPSWGGGLAPASQHAHVGPGLAPPRRRSSRETFSYSVAVQTFTVPAGVGSITVTMAGGQGGRGGGDSQGSPTSRRLSGFGHRRDRRDPWTADHDRRWWRRWHRRVEPAAAMPRVAPEVRIPSTATTARPAASLVRPVPSGGGGGSGAATVVHVAGIDIVAGGAGGNGGNGQFLAIVGRRAENEPSRPTRRDVTTVGRAGMNTITRLQSRFQLRRRRVGRRRRRRARWRTGRRPVRRCVGHRVLRLRRLSRCEQHRGASRSHRGLRVLCRQQCERFGGHLLRHGHARRADFGDRHCRRTARSRCRGPRRARVGRRTITDYVVEYATERGRDRTHFRRRHVDRPRPTTVTGPHERHDVLLPVAAVNSYGTGPKSPAMTIGVMPSDVPDRADHHRRWCRSIRAST